MKETTRKILIKAINYCYSWDRDLAYEYLRRSFRGRQQEIALDLWDDATEYPWKNWQELFEDILA